MTYIVYGAAGSGSVPVEAALILIGAPFEVVEAVTWEGETERDKVAGVNPMRHSGARWRDPDRERGDPDLAGRAPSGSGPGA